MQFASFNGVWRTTTSSGLEQVQLTTQPDWEFKVHSTTLARWRAWQSSFLLSTSLIIVLISNVMDNFIFTNKKNLNIDESCFSQNWTLLQPFLCWIPWIISISMYNFTAYLDDEEANADIVLRWLSVMYKPCDNSTMLKHITRIW